MPTAAIDTYAGMSTPGHARRGRTEVKRPGAGAVFVTRAIADFLNVLILNGEARDPATSPVRFGFVWLGEAVE